MFKGVLGRFLAMLTGFAIMAGLLSAVSSALAKLVPNWVAPDGSPRRPLMITNLCWSFPAATAGGYVTAWIARANPLDTALALAIVVLVLGGIGTVPLTMDQSPAELGGMTKTLTEQLGERLTPRSRAVEIQ